MAAALPKLLAVVGPTASGKTRLAIDLAKRFDGEVLSVDSRLVYRGMDIGTAKPEGEWVEAAIEPGSINQLFGTRRHLLVEGVPHWGIDLVEPDAEYGAAEFKTYAEARLADMLARGKTPILAGGTGMWLWTLLDNLTLAETPPNPALRAELDARPLHELFSEYKRLDPEGAEVIDRDNKRRVVRALEVTKITGKPFSAQIARGEKKYDALKLGLHVPRETLDQRINDRVDEMIARGLVDEVRALLARYGADGNAMSGIGYRQIAFFLQGKANLAAAIEETKRATRAYARRQQTWFKRDPDVQWIETPEAAFVRAETFIHR